jgi:hypothetical protein
MRGRHLGERKLLSLLLAELHEVSLTVPRSVL